MKKVFLALLLISASFSIVSCTDPRENYKYYEEDDYVFAISKFDSQKNKSYLYGLSEIGKTKEYLILPSEYNDIKVGYVGITLPTFMCGSRYIDDFNSYNLKKIFVNFELKDLYNETYYISETENIDDSEDIKRNLYDFVYWYDFEIGILDNFSPITKKYIFGNNLVSDEIINEKIEKLYFYKDLYYVANVSYQYNYLGAPNNGYYFVDNYDNELIKYIPPIPTRSGYVFCGWYKEAECINKWDFNSDYIGDQYRYLGKPNSYTPDGYVDFYNNYLETHTFKETRLYAKWVLGKDKFSRLEMYN